MVFFYVAIPFVLFSCWLLKKYLKLDYGTQTWHIPAFYFLAFCSFIFLNLGVISFMCGKGESEVVYMPEENKAVHADFNCKKQSKKGNDSIYGDIRCIRDTTILFPYLYSFITQQIDTKRLIVPVVFSNKSEFYLFRTDRGEKLIPVANTKFALKMDSEPILLITERFYRCLDARCEIEDGQFLSTRYLIVNGREVMIVY